MVQIEPGGDLTIGHDEDMSHPGGVAYDGPQRVPHFFIVLEPAGRDVVTCLLCLVGQLGGCEGVRV